MAIDVKCANGHVVRVKSEFAGKTGLCPHCHVRMRVPVPGQGANPHESDQFVRQSPSDHRAAREIAARPRGSPSSLIGTRLCKGCGSIASDSLAICHWCAGQLTVYRRLVLGKKGNSIVVGFADHGSVDDLTIKQIADEISDLADRTQKRDLVLDLSGVVGVSSAMLEKLLAIEFSMEERGADFRLRNVGPEVRAILAARKLDHMFRIEEDKAHVVNAFSQDRKGGKGVAPQQPVSSLNKRSVRVQTRPVQQHTSSFDEFHASNTHERVLDTLRLHFCRRGCRCERKS